MNGLGSSRHSYRLARVLLALALLITAGCAPKKESSEPPPPAADNASAPPPRTRVMVHQSNECLEFAPANVTIPLGDSVLWVTAPGEKDTLTIYLPGGGFAQTSWRLAPGDSVTSGPGLKQGSFPYTRPASCGKPSTGSPGVDIGGKSQP